MTIGVVVKQIIAHRVDDDLRHLRATRPIEVSDRLAVVLPGKGRKMGADFGGRKGRLGGGYHRAVCVQISGFASLSSALSAKFEPKTCDQAIGSQPPKVIPSRADGRGISTRHENIKVHPMPGAIQDVASLGEKSACTSALGSLGRLRGSG